MSSRDPLPSATPWLLRVSLGAWGALVVGLALARLAALPYAFPSAFALLVAMGLAHLPLVSAARVRRGAVGAFLAAQVVLFTLLLAATGGPANPLSVLYLVYVATAALALGARWGAGLAAITTAAFASLFALTDAHSLHAIHYAGGFTGHLVGMWLAYAISAGLVAFFLVRALATIAGKEQALEELREIAARQEKLLALGQLAAGAAHELGTPLATIALVAGELDRAARRGELATVDLAADAALLRSEAARCRRILDRMGAQAGATTGEAPEPLALPGVVEDAREGLGPDAARVNFLPPVDDPPPGALPRKALAQALVNLLRNALDATVAGGPAPELAVRYEGGALVARVLDGGAGVPASVRARLGQPFVTTKRPSGDEQAPSGMGLGLFLVQALADRFGGALTLAPRRDAPGTEAILSLPTLPSPPAPKEPQ